MKPWKVAGRVGFTILIVLVAFDQLDSQGRENRREA